MDLQLLVGKVRQSLRFAPPILEVDLTRFLQDYTGRLQHLAHRVTWP